MEKISDKTGRILVIVGLGAVCVILVIAISGRFKAAPVKDENTVSSPSQSAVTVGAINTESSQTDSRPSFSSGGTASSGKTDQTIQPDVSKPAAPSSKPTPQGNTADPSKAPTYNSKDTTAGKSSGPSGGEKKDGKVYLPGFGWVTDTGGSGTTVSGDGDINKQVGKMD